MKKIICIVFLNICFFGSQIFGEYKLFENDEFCQYRTAFSLCLKEHNQAGYIAAKAAMETYKDDKEIILNLKAICCLCVIDRCDYEEMMTFAEDVIKYSKKPLYIGMAWMKKAIILSHYKEYEKALNLSNISISVLENISPYNEEGKTALSLCCILANHYVKEDIYECLQMKQELLKEKEIIEKIISSWKY